MYNKIISINDSIFQEKVLNFSNYVIVIFWSKYCGPCKILLELINKKFLNYSDKLLFFKLDINKSNIIIEKYNILSVPTMLLFKNGKLLLNKIGLLNEDDFLNFLKISII